MIHKRSPHLTRPKNQNRETIEPRIFTVQGSTFSHPRVLPIFPLPHRAVAAAGLTPCLRNIYTPATPANDNATSPLLMAS